MDEPSRDLAPEYAAGILRHSSLPLQMHIDSAFDYLGDVTFDMPPARVRRCVFVEADGNQVRRQLIVQFEELVEPGLMYRWRVVSPLRLGTTDYQHDVYAWSIAADIAAAPGTEVDRTTEFLTERGYRQGDEQLMARFAWVDEAERRREVIIFYQEDLAGLRLTLAEVADADDGVRPEYADLAAGVTTRAREAFELT